MAEQQLQEIALRIASLRDICDLTPAQMAEKLGTDLVILPSSIHEVIVLPVSGKEDYDEMDNMIKDINRDQVAKEEVLSNHFYYYKYSSEKLMIPSVSF